MRTDSKGLFAGARMASRLTLDSGSDGLEDAGEAYYSRRVAGENFEFGDDVLEVLGTGEVFGQDGVGDVDQGAQADFFSFLGDLKQLDRCELDAREACVFEQVGQFRSDVGVAAPAPDDFAIKFDVTIVGTAGRIAEAACEIDIFDDQAASGFERLPHARQGRRAVREVGERKRL